MKKVFVTIFALALALIGFFVLGDQRVDHDAGQVRVSIHDGEHLLREDSLTFSEGESLFDILKQEYSLLCANASYQPTEDCNELLFGSPVILGIDEVLTNWTSSYFAIYINDEYSTLGVGNVYVEDGDMVRLQVQYLGGE